MRFWLVIILLCTATLAYADDARQAEMQAANANAVARLRDQIADVRIDNRTTVGQFIESTGTSDDLLKTLQQSEELGGPRWLDEQTCQVQLQISGKRIAAFLNSVATAHPHESPVPPGQIARLTDSWADRAFTATGVSTGKSTLNLVQGITPDSAWAGLPDKAREQAISAARDDAVSRVLDSVKSVPLTHDKTFGDALTDPEINRQATAWLEARPVTRVELREDMQAEITLSATPTETFAMFHDLLAAAPKFAPTDPADWDRARDDFTTHMAAPVGRAAVDTQAADVKPAIPLPKHTPDWVGKSIGASALAPRGDSQLKCARAAEALARKELRSKVETLWFGHHVNLGDVAGKNTDLADILTRSVDAAPVIRTDYNDPRGVKVWIELDGQSLWDAIRGEP